MGVKIEYCVRELLTFSGTVEVDEAVYKSMQEAEKNEDDELLGQLILDSIDNCDPQDWSIESVDEIEKA